jgi:hypothetical protein
MEVKNMQFVYRLGAVVFGTITFLVAYAIGAMVWLSHNPGAAAHVNREPTLEQAAAYVVGGSVPLVLPVAALATWVVVRIWRWVCGQDDRRPHWIKHPRTPLEKRAFDFVRESAHKTRSVDVSHLPSVRDAHSTREPRLLPHADDFTFISERTEDRRR